jgi:hypothetical protein
VVPVSFHDFFGGCASVAGALIGLLFVAISVSPQKLAGDRAHVEHQIRAAAAFSALVTTLAIALVSLLPTANLGASGIIVGVAGLATTVGLCLLLLREHRERIRRTDVSMLGILLVLYGLQLAIAIQLDRSPRDVSDVGYQGALLIGFFLFGIARSWQLVGARDTSLIATVAAVIHRSASENLRQEEGDRAGKVGTAEDQDRSYGA